MPVRTMHRSFRLVVIDVDGTLVDRNHPLSPAVRTAIARTQAIGVRVTLASGRMYSLLRPFIEALELRTPVICYGGAQIVNPLTRQVLYQRGVPLDLARAVILAARQRGLTARVYIGERVYVEGLAPDHFNYDALVRIGAEDVGDLLAFLAEEPTHLAIDVPADRTRQIVTEMRAIFGDSLHVTTGHPLLAEFSLPDVHKGSALAWLAAHLQISPAETLAIGDDWNDLEMLRQAGLGIAVANAHPDVLAAADATVPACRDDGVAVALERFVLRHPH